MASQRCIQCGRKLPSGRTRYCLRCQPTLDGKTALQKRRARERKQKTISTRIRQRRVRLNALIETILHNHPNPRAAAILRMRCGLNEEYDRTLKQVGDLFGITRERVRQIEEEVLGVSLSKLRYRGFN